MTRARPLEDQELDDGDYSPSDAIARGSQPVPSRRAATAEFLGAFAHDLNNPLAIVLTNLGFLSGLAKQIRTELGPAAGEGTRLASQLDEAEISLRDAQEALQRLRSLARTIVDPSTSTPPPASQSKAVFFPVPDGSAVRPARILIIDDEESLARALSRLFRDYDVVVHVDPADALERVSLGERFDVIVSDVAMPKMSGCELYEEIRRVSPEQAERVIFLTGGQASARVSNLLASIGQPVLSKPFDARELRAFIEKFLGKASSCNPSSPPLGA